jgi:hypothetical protein
MLEFLFVIGYKSYMNMGIVNFQRTVIPQILTTDAHTITIRICDFFRCSHRHSSPISSPMVIYVQVAFCYQLQFMHVAFTATDSGKP